MNREASLEYCHDVIGDVSRTFALSIEGARGLLSDYTCVSYLLCRIPDTIEDYNIPIKKKLELLNQYDEILNNNQRDCKDVKNFVEAVNKYRVNGPYWDLIQHTEQVFNAFETFRIEVRDSIRFHITKMIRGTGDIIRRHNDKIRIQDMDEFGEYCYYVAGTVGDMLTDLFQITEGLTQTTANKLRQYSRGFGEALQSVNIIKDVYNDYHEEDNIYVPQSLLNKYGTSHEKMLKDKEGSLKAIEELNQHATSKLEDAKKYIKLLPIEAKDARYFAIIPYLLAVSTLREAKRRGEELLKSVPIKISRSEVFAILERLPKCIKDNRYLEKLVTKAEEKEIMPKL